ncbi:MAG TPA: outer membrane protein transport protein [Rariglobus sp.]|jgi:long-chain fatty acid transport protein|nr:outer membrane protein transport protein [Rariglobus sp.]
MPAQHPRTRQSIALASLCAITLTVVPVTAFANGTRLPNQDAEATARSNAFAATADNPSAIYYNPAGITQLPGLQILAESYTVLAQNDYIPAGGGSRVEAKRQVAVVPQLYATYTPEKSPVSYGIGVYSPFGQATNWPDNSGFRTIATKNEIQFITIAPTVAWKICDQLSIGAGMQINQVSADLRSGLTPAPGNELHFKGDDTSLGYNLGLIWRINEHHVIGLTYQSRSISHFEGTVNLTPPVGASAPASLDLPFPDVIILGYSWRPTSKWNLEFNVDRTNWDLVNTPTLHSSVVTVPLAFNWKPSYYYEFGITRYLTDGWRISAGYCYSENSVPNSTFNPAVPDMARQLVSFGVGRTVGAISGYLTYQHGFKSTRDVSGAPTSVFAQSPDGRYEGSLDAIALSFRYAF